MKVLYKNVTTRMDISAVTVPSGPNLIGQMNPGTDFELTFPFIDLG